MAAVAVAVFVFREVRADDDLALPASVGQNVPVQGEQPPLHVPRPSGHGHLREVDNPRDVIALGCILPVPIAREWCRSPVSARARYEGAIIGR